MHQNCHPLLLRPNVVGIVDSPQALEVARHLKPGDVDALEWRADCLPSTTALPQLGFPWILTVRHPAEGGQNGLSLAERRRVFLSLLPSASAIDIEVRSITALHDIADRARAAGTKVIASFHDFKKSPSQLKLRHIVLRAARASADIVKIATVPQSSTDVAALLSLLSKSKIPTAVMGMGSYGMPSRLLFASCGSTLNYGWLHKPNVPGQWSAVELLQLLRRISQETA